MEAIVVFLAIMMLPFIIERFYFKVRHGGFALLLYVFLFQISCLAIASYAQALQPSLVIGKIFNGVFLFLGGLSYLTIAIPPILTIICAGFWVLIKLGEKVFGQEEDTLTQEKVDKT
jgi:hypothetical protein